MSWPNLPRLPVISDSQPANSAMRSRWLCHCACVGKAELVGKRRAHRRRLVAELFERAGRAAELHDVEASVRMSAQSLVMPLRAARATR